MTFKNKLQPKIKMCGLTNLPDARFVAGSLVDYMGFIFYPKSPRYIEPGRAGAIINWIEGPDCVGVFVNQPFDDVNMIARQTGVDLVQLHGDESPEYCSLVEKPVIKAIHITDEMEAVGLEDLIKSYKSQVDYFLFDNKTQQKWGGTGQTFDWSLLDEVPTETPFFLSGGLDAENVRKACETVQPFGVDLASGVESEAGKKSFEKIETFMHEVHEI